VAGRIARVPRGALPSVPGWLWFLVFLGGLTATFAGGDPVVGFAPSTGAAVVPYCHRVVPGFMAQAGGFDEAFEERPTGDPVPNESGNGLNNEFGTVAMARTNDPHSGRAQFYINLDDNRHLNPRHGRWGYAVFGRVVSGMDVVERIAGIPTGPRGPFPSDVPLQTVKIERATALSDWRPDDEGDE
jgi:cyclophilin family peptidyl-prolyl cis-trans isomerase